MLFSQFESTWITTTKITVKSCFLVGLVGLYFRAAPLPLLEKEICSLLML